MKTLSILVFAIFSQIAHTKTVLQPQAKIAEPHISKPVHTQFSAQNGPIDLNIGKNR